MARPGVCGRCVSSLLFSIHKVHVWYGQAGWISVSVHIDISLRTSLCMSGAGLRPLRVHGQASRRPHHHPLLGWQGCVQAFQRDSQGRQEAWQHSPHQVSFRSFSGMLLHSSSLALLHAAVVSRSLTPSLHVSCRVAPEMLQGLTPTCARRLSLETWAWMRA